MFRKKQSGNQLHILERTGEKISNISWVSCLAIFLAFCLTGTLFLSSCSNAGQKNEKVQDRVTGQESVSGEEKTVGIDPDRDRNISSQLQFERSMELTYAQEFAVDYYKDGYVLLSISDGSRYLVVPEGASVPEDLDEEIVILERPLNNIYLVASAVMDMFCELDGLDFIRFSALKAEDWYVDEAKKAMDEGKILYAGKYNSPDYEMIVSEGASLAIENTMIYHTPEVGEKLESFGIPMLVDYSSYESHPLGRVEWIRFYGALLGKEEIAEQAFQTQAEALKRVEEDENTGKTVAFFYITTNGAVNVRKSSDYVPKMIELAGGKYIFDQLGDDDSKSSSMSMQMEEFYASAKEADYLIYNSTIDGELGSVEELLVKSSLLADFKAVKEGNIWCVTNDLYQQSMSIGIMIEDIHSMLGDDRTEQENMQYLYPLE